MSDGLGEEKDKYMFFLHEGIRLGRRRSDDLWRFRVRRAYIIGLLIGSSVAVVCYRVLN